MGRRGGGGRRGGQLISKRRDEKTSRGAPRREDLHARTISYTSSWLTSAINQRTALPQRPAHTMPVILAHSGRREETRGRREKEVSPVPDHPRRHGRERGNENVHFARPRFVNAFYLAGDKRLMRRTSVIAPRHFTARRKRETK